MQEDYVVTLTSIVPFGVRLGQQGSEPFAFRDGVSKYEDKRDEPLRCVSTRSELA